LLPEHGGIQLNLGQSILDVANIGTNRAQVLKDQILGLVDHRVFPSV
jgi:hypothetical protein